MHFRPERDFPEDLVSEKAETYQTKQASAFSNISLDLTTEDLNSLGTQKLVIWHYEQLKQENELLHKFQTGYYQQGGEIAAFEVKFQFKKSYEIIRSLSLIIGAALLGFSAPSLNEFTPSSVVPFVIGLVSVVGGIFARATEK